MEVKHGLGYQNYADMMRNSIFYVDKTDFIREWWDNADLVTLITRPRRFGKTLNMSTVECFFSNQYKDKKELFEGRKVWEDESLRKLQGTYPVIFMSFAGVKAGGDQDSKDGKKIDSVDTMKICVKKIIARVYDDFKHIMCSELFDDSDREYYASVTKMMTDETAATAVSILSRYLERFYQKKAIILLDEYDTPMQEAWIYGYWDQAVAFLKSFFVNTFKDNQSMERGLITGITRISKESIFSELNHLEVVTMTSDKYATSFGFTEEEVFQALEDSGFGSCKEGVKRWYDGFTIGKNTDIYNPWSIISFIGNKGKYAAYWANTSSNGLVSVLMRQGSANVKEVVEDLIAGKSFTVPIDEQIVFSQLEEDENAVWSLLMASGYLKTIEVEERTEFDTDDMNYTLALTNLEVQIMFKKMIRGWFAKNRVKAYYNEFINSLFNDNVRKMNTFMNKVALNTFSSFDVGNKPSEETEPERFYHGFVLGMIVNLSDRYQVTSNRESGYGRYDVMMEPLDKNEKAFIFEFKVLDADDDEEKLEDTVANALAQIEEKQYEAVLVANGFAKEKIRKYGFAFQGKKCLIG